MPMQVSYFFHFYGLTEQYRLKKQERKIRNYTKMKKSTERKWKTKLEEYNKRKFREEISLSKNLF